MGRVSAWSALTISLLVRLAKSVKAPPPREIPGELLSAFTLNGQIPVEKYYVDDSNNGEGTHYAFSRADIDAFIRYVDSQKGKLARDRNIAGKSWRGNKDTWIYDAFDHYPIKGLDVAVFGSLEPYYEAICLSHGAKTVTTIDYNKLTFDHPQLRTLTVKEFESDDSLKFDVALSISSFDHDGLGRYGDPLDAEGDIKAMQMVKGRLKAHGTFFISVPIGPDVLVWNLHRRYGRVRLPKLLNGWTVQARFGWNEQLLESPRPFTQSHETVHVLKPASEPMTTTRFSKEKLKEEL